jgi:pimeloyl-ACP methyl ester carboxylesterase
LRHIPHANYLQDLVELFRPLPALQSVGAPVLVLRSTIAGYQDEAAVDRRLGELIDCHVEAIHCHHWPVTERPHEVRRLIEDWIERREGRSRPRVLLICYNPSDGFHFRVGG